VGEGCSQALLAHLLHDASPGDLRHGSEAPRPARRDPRARPPPSRPPSAVGLLGGLRMQPVVRVLAPNPSVYTLEGTNTWVVGEDPAVVIDPGPLDPEHLDEVARVAGRVGAVLVTHDHPDHAPGALTFARRVGAPLRAFRLDGAEHVRDGERIEMGATAFVAVHTPGHASDHVVFHLPADGALFTGDAVVGRGTSFIDPPDGDLAQYLRSLKRMQ